MSQEVLCWYLQEFLKFCVSQASATDNVFECVRIDTRVARYDYFFCAVSHSSVFCSVWNPETSFFESSYRTLMWYVSEKHTLSERNFYRTHLYVLCALLNFVGFHFKVGFNCVFNVFDSFLFSISLTGTAWQHRHVYIVSVFAFM